MIQTAARLSPRSGKAADSLVVLFHGWGANGRDLMPLAETWAPVVSSTAFVAPDAPMPCTANSFGRQWFGLNDMRPLVLYAGVCSAAEQLNPYLNHLLTEYNLPDQRLALVGFSQGAMMALHVGPRRSACAGVVAYSGLLVEGQHLANELKNKSPILVVHGAQDEVVPATVFKPTIDSLKRAGLPVTSYLAPGLGHSIDAEGLQRGGQFLKTAFS